MNFILPELKTPLNLVGVPSLVSKYLRLTSIAGHVRVGNVLIPGRLTESGNIEAISFSKPMLKAWSLFPSGDQDLLDAFEKAISLAAKGPPPVSMAITAEDAKRKARSRLDRSPTGVTRTFGSYTRVFRNHQSILSNDE
jgi:hypothetical protein